MNKILKKVLILSLLAITAPYALTFGGFTISQTPEAWGQFGDYIGGMLTPLIAYVTITSARDSILDRINHIKNERDIYNIKHLIELSSLRIAKIYKDCYNLDETLYKHDCLEQHEIEYFSNRRKESICTLHREVSNLASTIAKYKEHDLCSDFELRFIFEKFIHNIFDEVLFLCKDRDISESDIIFTELLKGTDAEFRFMDIGTEPF